MTCGFDKELLFEYAVGELAAGDRRQVDDHLIGCPSCRDFVAFERRLAHDLGALPAPAFPDHLEGVLVRASMEAARSAASARPSPKRDRIHAGWLYAFGGLAGSGMLVLLVLLLWPGRFIPLSPVDSLLGTSPNTGHGFLDGLLRSFQDLRAGWSVLQDFLSRFAPVQKAIRVALGGVASTFWFSIALGVALSVALVWRVARGSQKRSVGHAKPH